MTDDIYYAPSTRDVIERRVRRTCERYVGAPLNSETLDAMESELRELVRRYIEFGEVRPFPLEQVRVSTDPADPNRILVRVGERGDSYDPFSGMMPP